MYKIETSFHNLNAKYAYLYREYFSGFCYVFLRNGTRFGHQNFHGNKSRHEESIFKLCWLFCKCLKNCAITFLLLYNRNETKK